jgi:acyl carrier protein
LQGSLQVSAYSFVQALELHLAEWLPACMVPETYIKVGMIPRDAHGRVQYELLPVPERNDHDGTRIPPSATTSKVTSIVENLLNVERVGAEDNLLDLGMDSINAIRLAARLNDAFGVQPATCQVFTTPTVSGISHSVVEALRVNGQILAEMEQEASMS